MSSKTEKGITISSGNEAHMKKRIQRASACIFAVLLVFAVSLASILLVRGAIVNERQREAENILFYYRGENCPAAAGTVNEATALAQTVHTAQSAQADASAWFETAAVPLLQRPEVCMVALFGGDILGQMLPQDKYGSLDGKSCRIFPISTPCPRWSRSWWWRVPWCCRTTPEGQEVFLVLQPIVEEGACLGQVAVALDRDYVLGQLGLENLSAQGYDYELWRVEPQNGNKEIVASSQAGTADFSQAQKTAFNLPTQWTLSIQPRSRWLSVGQRLGLALLCILIQVLLLSLLFLLRRTLQQKPPAGRGGPHGPGHRPLQPERALPPPWTAGFTRAAFRSRCFSSPWRATPRQSG